jgi:NADH dehydrogenase (ubiquinone) 1 beta subcomplex subunit 8
VLGVFSLEDYRHMTTSRGLLLWGGFISVILGLSYAVTVSYPGKPSAPTEYEAGLDRELGGAGAVRVSNGMQYLRFRC